MSRHPETFVAGVVALYAYDNRADEREFFQNIKVQQDPCAMGVSAEVFLSDSSQVENSGECKYDLLMYEYQKPQGGIPIVSLVVHSSVTQSQLYEVGWCVLVISSTIYQRNGYLRPKYEKS